MRIARKTQALFRSLELPPRKRPPTVRSPLPHQLITIAKPDFASMRIIFETRTKIAVGAEPKLLRLLRVHRRAM